MKVFSNEENKPDVAGRRRRLGAGFRSWFYCNKTMTEQLPNEKLENLNVVVSGDLKTMQVKSFAKEPAKC